MRTKDIHLTSILCGMWKKSWEVGDDVTEDEAWSGHHGMLTVPTARALHYLPELPGHTRCVFFQTLPFSLLHCSLLSLPPGCILDSSLTGVILKEQNPEGNQDQASDGHADEILHCVIFGVGGSC